MAGRKENQRVPTLIAADIINCTAGGCIELGRVDHPCLSPTDPYPEPLGPKATQQGERKQEQLGSYFE